MNAASKRLKSCTRSCAARFQPTMAYRQLPLLTSPPTQCTMRQPMINLVKKLHQLESEDDVITATLSMGFPVADIHDAGVSVLGNHRRGPGARRSKGRGICATHLVNPRILSHRSRLRLKTLLGMRIKTEGQPIVLAEGSDNPGGGGPCDSTFILQRFP